MRWFKYGAKKSPFVYVTQDIPFIFQVAALLAAFTHPSHIVIYAPGDSFTCRLAATRNLLGIYHTR
ncbi:hypothetical protein C5470_18750 [Photorhabdus stackebrandtii]|uniref:Uncharacterized protein n=1 Tax=Photorhabdus stackebrandtii TaxID=1123042 RepID=A0A7X5QPP2_9GAMM|nr:hypothetical protein [Photorhabdus stackebrandtii]